MSSCTGTKSHNTPRSLVFIAFESGSMDEGQWVFLELQRWGALRRTKLSCKDNIETGRQQGNYISSGTKGL